MDTSFHNITTLHPVGLVAVVLLGVAMLLVPRRYALVPVLVMACFISPAQRLVVASLDFNVLRLLVAFGCARVVLYGEYRGFRWKPLDGVVIAWAVAATVVMTVRLGTVDALINRLGMTYDALGMYFLFRCLIREWDDLQILGRAIAVLSVPVAAIFLIEHATARNMFAVLGGVPETTMLRAGRLRCQGPFPHPIVAGCFWAALAPLIVGLAVGPRAWRWLVPVGLVSATTVIMTTASSTPVAVFLITIPAMAFYPARRHLRWAIGAGVLGCVLLQIVMNNPIWHLLTRIDLVGGSAGWHRYKLVDLTIRNVDQWWLLGTEAYRTWMRYGSEDLANEYVRQALLGGLATLVLFLGVLGVAFAAALRTSAPTRSARSFMAWTLVVSLVVHCASFIALAYFGQVLVAFYLGLAAIGSLGVVLPVRRYRVRRVRSAPVNDAKRVRPCLR